MIRYSPAALFIVVTGIGSAIEQELINTGGGAVNRACYLVPGDIAWDECDCGMLAQTIQDVFPSSTFPVSAADQRVTPCGPPLLVALVQASVIRCVPGPDGNGEAPPCSALLEVARVLEADRYAARRAVTCYLLDLKNRYEITDYTVGNAPSIGPQGNCVGFTLTYHIGIANDCCG